MAVVVEGNRQRVYLAADDEQMQPPRREPPADIPDGDDPAPGARFRFRLTV